MHKILNFILILIIEYLKPGSPPLRDFLNNKKAFLIKMFISITSSESGSKNLHKEKNIF